MNGEGTGMGMIDDQPVGDLADGRDDILMRAVADDQAPCRRATLARAEEGGLAGDDRGRVWIGRVPDDERIVAAKLERQDLLRRFGELAGGAPGRRAPIR
jgi:hypothetical protein